MSFLRTLVIGLCQRCSRVQAPLWLTWDTGRFRYCCAECRAQVRQELEASA